MILSYSATGNTEWVANRLSTLLCDTHLVSACLSLSRVQKEVALASEKGEMLGVLFPVHAWGMPKLVEQIICALPSNLSIPYIYMVCTCGDDIGCTDRVFQKLLKSKGLTCDLLYSVQMPNTYVTLPGFDVDDMQVESHKLEEAEKQVTQIAHAVATRQKLSHCHHGSCAWLKSFLLRPLFHRFLVTDHYFRVNDACVGCGKCAKSCPVGNIVMKDTPVWRHTRRCNTCLACYHTCPYHAIEWGRYTSKKGQYLHPDK